MTQFFFILSTMNFLSVCASRLLNRLNPFTLWMAILSSIGLTCVASQYLIDSDGWSSGQFFYFYAFCLGHFFLLSAIIILIGAGIRHLTKNHCFASNLTIFCLFLLTTYVVADVFVYQLYRSHIDVAMLQMTFLAGGQVVQFSTEMMLYIGILITFIALAIFLLIHLSSSLTFLRKTAFTIASLSLGCLIATNVLHAYAFPINKVSILNVVNHVPLTAPLKMKSIFLKVGILTPEQIEQSSKITTPFNAGFNYPKCDLTFGEITPKFNVIMIYVDTLRRDYINDDTAPNISEFIKNSINFTNYISGGSYTKAGLFSLFYGLPANYWMNALSSTTQSVLITAFQKKQYDIEIFNSSGLTQPPFDQTIFSKVKNLTTRKENTPWERDKGATNDYIKWIKSRGAAQQPFFNFIFFDSIHGYSFPEDKENTIFTPYWDEVNHLKLNNDFDPTEYKNRYRNSLHYVDKQIGRILSTLRQLDLFDKSVIIISSDHGETFNEEKQNRWGHGSGFMNSLVQIPLYIHWPGKSQRTYNHLASSLDLTATLLPDVLGCTTPLENYTLGRSLWNESTRNFVYSSSYSDDAFIEDKRIVIRNKYGLLEFLNRDYTPSNNKSIPPYTREILQDLTRFSK